MTWNTGDGIGVTEARSSGVGWEYDEIEWQEELAVSFLDACDDPYEFYLEEIKITDLFNEHGYLEQGRYRLLQNTL